MYRDCHEDAVHVDLQMQDIHYRIRKSTEKAFDTLSEAPLDTCSEEIPLETETIEQHGVEICQNKLSTVEALSPVLEDLVDEYLTEEAEASKDMIQKCKNELLPPRVLLRASQNV